MSKQLRHVFKLTVIERVDAESEEDARALLERSEEWELIDVRDIPTGPNGEVI